MKEMLAGLIVLLLVGCASVPTERSEEREHPQEGWRTIVSIERGSADTH